MKKYKEIVAPYPDGDLIGIMDNEEGHTIPLSEANRHYREYLEWVEAGNTPDPMFTEAEWDAVQASKQKLKDKKLVDKELRKDTIQRLKDEGKLPPDYTEDE